MKNSDEIILSIYDAAMDPTLWPNVLLDAAHFVGARGATVFELDEICGSSQLKMSMCSANYNPDRNRYYLEHHGKDELQDQEIFASHSKRSDGIQLISEDVLYTDRDEYITREHVQILRHFDVGYRAAALLNKDLPNIDRFAFQFSHEHGPMDSHAQEKSRIILPHLAKALNVSRPFRELNAQKDAISNSLDFLVLGVCILDQQNHIIVSNREFQRQIDSFSVFTRDRFGRLQIDRQLAPTLQTFISASFESHGIYGARPRKEAVVFTTVDKDQHLCIDVIPCASCDSLDVTGRAMSVLFSLDTSQKHRFDEKKIKDVFELTPSEMQVLKFVTDGFTNQQISERLEKSVHTIDTQMKSIFSKSMAANRTQLVRIISQTSSYLISPQAGG